MIIHAYNRGAGVKALAHSLNEEGHKTLILDRQPQGKNPFVIGWGAKELDHPLRGVMLNMPIETKKFSNKLTFFKAAGGSPFVPCWTVGQEEAQKWSDNGHKIVARHVLAGSGGEGIDIIEPKGIAPKAPLYVEYQKKTDEYRLHMFKKNGTFIPLLIQKKVAKPGAVIANWGVRNLENGFIFQQNGFQTPKTVTSASTLFLEQSFPNIDFVALDIIYHKPSDSAYILEGNTAPGLQGKTIKIYRDYFIEKSEAHYNEMRNL